MGGQKEREKPHNQSTVSKNNSKGKMKINKRVLSMTDDRSTDRSSLNEFDDEKVTLFIGGADACHCQPGFETCHNMIGRLFFPFLSNITYSVCVNLRNGQSKASCRHVAWRCVNPTRSVGRSIGHKAAERKHMPNVFLVCSIRK